jgi:glycosyltransferase involved in cell wall biosynthesis
MTARSALRGVSILAVVPVHNEAATIGGVVAALTPRCPVIVVDDASTDDSGRQAVSAGAVCVLRHPTRIGKAAALRTGFAEALRRGAAHVATLDGDGQHDPADLPRLVAAAHRHANTLVLGDRLRDPAGDRMPALRSVAIQCADRVLGWLIRADVRDSQCGYRIYPARFLRMARLVERGFTVETEAIVAAARIGVRLASVPVRRIYPVGRRSRFQALPDGLRIARYLAREVARELRGPRRAPGLAEPLGLPARAGER